MGENNFKSEPDDEGHDRDELEQKEASEHASFSKKQIKQIVKDHLADGGDVRQRSDAGQFYESHPRDFSRPVVRPDGAGQRS